MAQYQNENENVEEDPFPPLPGLLTYIALFFLFFLAIVFSAGFAFFIVNSIPKLLDCSLDSASLSVPNNGTLAIFRFTLQLLNGFLFSSVHYKNLSVSLYYDSELLNGTEIILPYLKVFQNTHQYPVISVFKEDFNKNVLSERFFDDYRKNGMVKVEFRLTVQTRLIKG